MAEAIGSGPGEWLRDRVVALAGARFEKYYHHSTCTHIVKQLEGTEFRASGIKGTGDFADEAYADYLRGLGEYVRSQDEARLSELEARLSSFAPIGERKVELQVQVPDELAERVRSRARANDLGLGAYVNALLDSWLPFDIDEAQIEVVRARLVRLAPPRPDGRVTRNHTLTLPVGQRGFERLERFAGVLAMSDGMTMGDAVLRMMRAQEAALVPGQLH